MRFSPKSEDLFLSVFLTQKAPSKEHFLLRGYTFALTNRKCNFHLCSAGTKLGKKLLSNLPFLPTSQSIKTPPSALSLLIRRTLCSHFTFVASSSVALERKVYSISCSTHWKGRGSAIMFPVYTSTLLNSIYILM